MFKKLFLLFFFVSMILSPCFTSSVSAQTDSNYEDEIKEAFPDMEGILPIVKIIAYKKIKGGEIAPLNVGIGLLISEQGLVMAESSLDYLYTYNSPLIQKEYYADWEKPDIYNICFIRMDNPGNFDCSGTASQIGKNDEQGFQLLQINEKDINGRNLTFPNYFNYKNDIAPAINDPLKIIGFKNNFESQFIIYDTKYIGLAEDGQYQFEYNIEDNFKLYSNNIGINKGGELVGLYTDYNYENTGFLHPIADLSVSIDALKNQEFTTDTDAQNLLINYQKKFNTFNELNKIYEEDLSYKTVFNDNWVALPNTSVNPSSSSDPLFYFFDEKDGIKLVPIKSDGGYDENSYVYFYEKKLPYGVTKAEIENIIKLKKYIFQSLFSTIQLFISLEKPELSNLEEINLNDKIEGYKSEITVPQEDSTTKKTTYYYIPNGYKLMGIIVCTTSHEYDEDITEMLDSYAKSAESDYSNEKKSVTVENPYLYIENDADGNGWYIADRNWNNYYTITNEPISDNLVYLEMIRPEDLYNRMNFVHQSYSFENQENSSTQESLQTILDSHTIGHNNQYIEEGALKIDSQDGIYAVFKDEIYNTEEEKLELTRILIVLPDKEEEGVFGFEMDVESSKYEEFLPDFKNVLNKIRLTDSATPGEYSLPEFKGLFSDISDNNYSYQIVKLANKGIVQGYDDGSFRPDNNINRAEFLKIVIEGLNPEQKKDFQYFMDNEYFPEKEDAVYSDVDLNAWYYKYISYATTRGIVKGYPDGSFGPEKEISLPESLKMLYLANKIEVEIPGDLKPEEWYLPYMDKGYMDNIIPVDIVIPYDISSFTHLVTRGEMCYSIYMLLFQPAYYYPA